MPPHPLPQSQCHHRQLLMVTVEEISHLRGIHATHRKIFHPWFFCIWQDDPSMLSYWSPPFRTRFPTPPDNVYDTIERHDANLSRRSNAGSDPNQSDGDWIWVGGRIWFRSCRSRRSCRRRWWYKTERTEIVIIVSFYDNIAWRDSGWGGDIILPNPGPFDDWLLCVHTGTLADISSWSSWPSFMEGCGEFVLYRLNDALVRTTRPTANTSTHCSSILLLTSASIDLEIALFRASLFTWPFIAWTARWGGIPLCCTYHKIKNGTDGDHHRREFFTKNIAYRHDKKTKKQQEDGHQTTINLTMYKAVATSPLHMGAVVFLVFADDMALERLGGSIVPL